MDDLRRCAVRRVPAVPARQPFATDARATLTYACGHRVRNCCVVRILRSTTGTLDCPFCVDPTSVLDLQVAALGDA